jgi:hypothetical protein
VVIIKRGIKFRAKNKPQKRESRPRFWDSFQKLRAHQFDDLKDAGPWKLNLLRFNSRQALLSCLPATKENDRKADRDMAAKTIPYIIHIFYFSILFFPF